MTKNLTIQKSFVSEQLAINKLLKKFDHLENMTFRQEKNFKNEVIRFFKECVFCLSYEKRRGNTRKLFFLEKSIEECQTLAKQLNLSL